MNGGRNADAIGLVARPPEEFRPHGITQAAMIASAIAAQAMLMARYFCCSLMVRQRTAAKSSFRACRFRG